MTSRHPLGVVTLVCIVIANMVGAGVFTTSGYSLTALGSPSLVLLAWFIASVVAICGAVSYGELARRMPQSGGEYLFLSQKVSPFVGFLSGWVSLTAGFSGAIALSGLTFAEYILPDGSLENHSLKTVIAVTAIVVCGLGHSFLQRSATIAQNVIVGIKIIALAAFLGTAAWAVPTHTWHWDPLPQFSSTGLALLPPLATSVMWISFSFAGFNAAVYVASEVPNARRNVPRALLTGTCIVAVLYLLLNLVFVTAAPVETLADQANIAAVAARAIGGTPLELLIRGTIAVATLSSVAVMIMSGPRVYARMADDGMFFQYFSGELSGIHRAVLLQTGLAAGLACFGTIRGLLSYLGATLALSSAASVATVLFPSRSGIQQSASSEIDGTKETASLLVLSCSVVYVVATCLFIVLMTVDDPSQLLGTLATLLLGTGLWLFTKRTRTKPHSGNTGNGRR
jgi:amino acid transporter